VNPIGDRAITQSKLYIGDKDMKVSRMRRALVVGALISVVFQGAQAAWPEKPITIVVPVPPGGSGDLLARTIAQRLPAILGQPVIVDNKPGASTMLGSEQVVHAKPDGHTVLLAISSLATLPATSPKTLRFDPTKDLMPVTLAVKLPLVVVARPDAPFDTMQKLLAYGRANPAKLSVAVSPGPGSSAHLALERLKLEGGFRAVAIPYRGTAPTMQALLAGEIPVAIDSIGGAAPFIAEGRMKPLAVMTDKRSTGLPSIPTVAELGFPGFEADTWMGFMLPAKTPANIQERLNSEINAILNDPEVRTQLVKAGMEPIGTTPEQFGKTIAQGIDTWNRVVKVQNLKFD
jgi:tripartite-type tricarboxylate transporter receptor subunit TctC